MHLPKSRKKDQFMTFRLANPYLIALLLLTGCAGKPTAQQDITLAGSEVQRAVQAAPAKAAPPRPQTSDAQAKSSTVTSGSGATTNIVSDPSLYSDRSAITSTSATLDSPIAIPSPVQSPSRLATAMMVEPASDLSSGDDRAKISAAGAPEPSSGHGSASQSAATQTEKKVASKVLTLKRTKPDCKGSDCPVLNFKRLTFTGYDRFNAFLEQTLLSLALVESNRDKAFRDLAELELYFFNTASPRNEISLASSVKYMSDEVIVVQLDSYIFTGGAHGISTTQYLNWLPKTDKLLTLEAMLLPGKLPAFEEALKQQHALWLKKNPLAKDDPTAYSKLWPFEPSDNVALLENGLAVTYDAYRLAPYSFGKPTIYIPYRELKGILRPEALPKN
jgi:hypothetical protein